MTADRFLNKVVLNPPLALWYAVATHRRLQHERGLESFLPDADVAAAARRLFPGTAPDASLDETLRRVAAGSPGPAPRHIYVVLMESYDTWPLLPQYRSLRLTEQLQALGRERLFLRQALPASDGTMKSIAAIVTGVPESGLRTSYQPAALRPYATSLPMALRRLGYRTRFFYGGSLGWERLDELVDGRRASLPAPRGPGGASRRARGPRRGRVPPRARPTRKSPPREAAPRARRRARSRARVDGRTPR